jgi:hypothetical protein
MSIPVNAYVPGHGVFIASLTSVLRTASILDAAWRPEDGEQPYPFPYRATLERWAVTCGFAEKTTDNGIHFYLMDHEDEEQCLVMLASFHPDNATDEWNRSLANVESWERSLEALSLEAIQEDGLLARQFALASGE